MKCVCVIPTYGRFSLQRSDIPIIFFQLTLRMIKSNTFKTLSSSRGILKFYKCIPNTMTYNRPPFRMEYRHLTKMRGTKKLLWNWNISLFQLLMDCLINNDMKSYKKPWNTLPQLWNLLISIFHSSMEFHGIPWNSPEVPWNSMEFHGTFPCQKGSSMEFHGTLKVPWNLMPTPNSMEFHGIPWNRQT